MNVCVCVCVCVCVLLCWCRCVWVCVVAPRRRLRRHQQSPAFESRGETDYGPLIFVFCTLIAGGCCFRTTDYKSNRRFLDRKVDS